jgi:hypothetical protein
MTSDPRLARGLLLLRFMAAGYGARDEDVEK